MIREALSAVARNESIGGLVSRTPLARDVVKRVAAGDSVDAALVVAGDLADRGFWVSLERAAPDVESDEAAEAVLTEYLDLVARLESAGLVQTAEVAVFAASLGTGVAAFDRLDRLCERATAAGVPVILGMEPEADIDEVIAWAEESNGRGHPVGVTLQACMRRTEADCARLADRRVRLVKGVHRGGPGVAFGHPMEVDKAFVRCAKVLLHGTGEPSFATHDLRLVEIVESLATRNARAHHSYEFAFFMGRQEGTQDRLAAEGERVRVYVPYGPDWFERLVGGLAEQPSSIAAAVRSLLPWS